MTPGNEIELLRLGRAPVSKHDRPAKAAKAGRVLVRPDMTVAQGFQAIMAACIRHFRLNEPLVIEQNHVEALHQARVAMRRLRSALSLFRPAVADADFERLRSELRWFTGELSAARNLDVLLQRDLPEAERERLGQERERAHAGAIAAMEAPRFRRLMLDLSSWVAGGEWRRNEKAAKALAPFVDRRVDRLWRRVTRARKLRAMDVSERHELRIEVKKLRYALEFSAALHVRHPKRRKKFGKAIEEIQDSLGSVHDISVASSLLAAEVRPTLAEQKAEERRHLRTAKLAFRRLREIGPYWRGRR